MDHTGTATGMVQHYLEQHTRSFSHTGGAVHASAPLPPAAAGSPHQTRAHTAAQCLCGMVATEWGIQACRPASREIVPIFELFSMR